MLSKPSAIEWRTSLTVTSSSRSTKHLPRSAPVTAGGIATLRGRSALARFAGSPLAAASPAAAPDASRRPSPARSPAT